jgi:hypothetical protein
MFLYGLFRAGTMVKGKNVPYEQTQTFRNVQNMRRARNDFRGAVNGRIPPKTIMQRNRSVLLPWLVMAIIIMISLFVVLPHLSG